MAQVRFDETALRVLGSLVEKDRTTPEYYPLSANALTAACNQRSNRDPVLALDEREVMRGLEVLREAGLAHPSAGGGRVVRYAHNLHGKLQIDAAEVAVLAELLLRGPQTAGELRARAERMHHFADLGEVEAAITRLVDHDPSLVERLPRQPGQKEARVRHRMGTGAAPASTQLAPGAAYAAPVDTASATALVRGGGDSGDTGDTGDRLDELEREVVALRAEVRALWKELRSLTLEPEPDGGGPDRGEVP